ncbi:MAG: ACT domain-containing protein [Nocardioides sp.]|nr:ACT domain-containing protein [Nocardioides sp.]
MDYDVTVILDDRPGELARLGEAAGAAGVNIDGFAAFTGESRGVVHVLVHDDLLEKLENALTDAGMPVADTREVFIVNVANEPGALGEVARRLADANVNIDLAYTTFGGTRLVFCTDDVRSARELLDI